MGMSTKPRTRRGLGRPPAGQATLTVDRILDTALEIVDGQSLEALSMRRLARELEVDPMSIYHHLPNKAAVISGLVERVFNQMRLPNRKHGDWTTQARGWVHAYHELTRAHPHLVLQIVSDPAAVAVAGEMIDPPLQNALAQAGLPAEKIDPCADMLVDYVNGYALAEVAQQHPCTAEPLSQTGFDTGLDVMMLGIQTLASHAVVAQTQHDDNRNQQEPTDADLA